MDGIKKIREIKKYCDYIEEHLINVKTAWGLLQEKCKDMRFIYDDFVFYSIGMMIDEHDRSKLSSAEFIQYADWFFGDYGKEWESSDTEHEAEHKTLHDAFDSAWIHHQKNNPHHWQNWTKTAEKTPYDHECHCVCMVVDWMAMGMKFNDTAKDYYDKNKEKIDLPDWAVRFIYGIFDRITPERELK